MRLVPSLIDINAEFVHPTLVGLTPLVASNATSIANLRSRTLISPAQSFLALEVYILTS